MYEAVNKITLNHLDLTIIKVGFYHAYLNV